MDQGEINKSEWNNPENWSGPRWMRLYFSKRDSRTWVPKPIPAMGWTINLGKDAGAYWFLGSIIIPPLLIVAALLLSEMFL